eukprot:6460430-Amphidinium_carterae.2
MQLSRLLGTIRQGHPSMIHAARSSYTRAFPQCVGRAELRVICHVTFKQVAHLTASIRLSPSGFHYVTLVPKFQQTEDE